MEKLPEAVIEWAEFHSPYLVLMVRKLDEIIEWINRTDDRLAAIEDERDNLERRIDRLWEI